MLPLDYQTIYNALDPSWWRQNPFYGMTSLYTDIYFTDTAGTTDVLASSAYTSQTEPADIANVVTHRRESAAQRLVNWHCTGGITNIRPASFQPMPIYFR